MTDEKNGPAQSEPTQSDKSNEDVPMERRTFLAKSGALGVGAIGAGALGLGAGLSRPGFAAAAAAGGLAPATSPSSVLTSLSCTLTPTAIQGPFYFDPNLVRVDITEGKPGLPVTLFFQVLDSDTCAPIKDAEVDVWQNDGLGSYSGYASEGTAGQTFLRGIQTTAGDGICHFETIYPGWYPGRTPHLHIKVRPTPNSELTTQVYFQDWLSALVYTNIAPYTQKGVNPTKNSTDGFYKQGTDLLFGLHPNGSVALWAGIQLSVKTS